MPPQEGDAAASLSLPDSATDVGGPSDMGYHRGRAQRQPHAGPDDMLGASHGSLRHWHSHGHNSIASSMFPTLATTSASAVPSSAHEGQHPHHSHSQHSHGSHQRGFHRSSSHGHGHGHHNRTHSHGHGHAHYPSHANTSSRAAAGHGSLAALFPSMGGHRQTTGPSDEGFGPPPVSPSGAPASLPQVPPSPRSGGGGASERGRDGMDVAPSLARESMRSRETIVTERTAEAEEASMKCVAERLGWGCEEGFLSLGKRAGGL